MSSLWCNPFRLAMRVRSPIGSAFRRPSMFVDSFGDHLTNPFNAAFDTAWLRQVERMERAMDRFFDNEFPVRDFGLADGSARMEFDENGKMLYRINVGGYKPEELNVEVHEGAKEDDPSYVTVSGKYKNESGAELVRREFTRSFRIPDEIKVDTIKCGLDENGQMCIAGEPANVENAKGTKRRAIPIDVNKPLNSAASAAPIDEGKNEKA